MEKVLADYTGSPDILVASVVCNPEARGASLCTRHDEKIGDETVDEKSASQIIS